MIDLEGKRAIVIGIADDKSIAWSIARKLDECGCQIAAGYQERVQDQALALIGQLRNPFAETCDVTSDDSLGRFFDRLGTQWKHIDFLVHSIAFARRQDLNGRFLNTGRKGWQIAQDVSAFSLVNLLQRSLPLMSSGGSCVAMTYLGSERVIPGYNVMGVGKAALEASVRYAADDVGGSGIRVNAVSAGPIATSAATALASFPDVQKRYATRAPLQRLVTQEEVANSVLFLLSDLASGITGEILHVDGGYNITGA